MAAASAGSWCSGREDRVAAVTCFGCLHAEVPRPFDFLVAGELVRQPLQQLATALGISAVPHPLLSCFVQPTNLSRRKTQLCL